MDLKIDQITFYPLMPSSSVKSSLAKNIGQINYAREKKFYFNILKRLSGYLDPSTVWCFSRNHSMIDEYIVNHNEYIGTGSGSFGYLDGTMFANTFSVQQYIDRLNNGELPVTNKKIFKKREQARYDFLVRLFSRQINIQEFEKKYSGKFLKYLWKELFFLKSIGAIRQKEDKIFLTHRGMYYWVIMMREFFISVNNFRDYCRKR